MYMIMLKNFELNVIQLLVHLLLNYVLWLHVFYTCTSITHYIGWLVIKCCPTNLKRICCFTATKLKLACTVFGAPFNIHYIEPCGHYLDIWRMFEQTDFHILHVHSLWRLFISYHNFFTWRPWSLTYFWKNFNLYCCFWTRRGRVFIFFTFTFLVPYVDDVISASCWSDSGCLTSVVVTCLWILPDWLQRISKDGRLTTS